MSAPRSPQDQLARSERIAESFRAEALAVTAESAPTHHETVWSEVCGAVAFALSMRNPQLSAYDVQCEAERLMMHLQIDSSDTGLRTTRDLMCGGC